MYACTFVLFVVKTKRQGEEGKSRPRALPQAGGMGLLPPPPGSKSTTNTVFSPAPAALQQAPPSQSQQVRAPATSPPVYLAFVYIRSILCPYFTESRLLCGFTETYSGPALCCDIFQHTINYIQVPVPERLYDYRVLPACSACSSRSTSSWSH